MAAGIDLPSLSAVTGIPQPTLRYWVQKHGWKPVGIGPFGAKLYSAATVKEHIFRHPATTAALKAEAERLADQAAA